MAANYETKWLIRPDGRSALNHGWNLTNSETFGLPELLENEGKDEEWCRRMKLILHAYDKSLQLSDF